MILHHLRSKLASMLALYIPTSKCRFQRKLTRPVLYPFVVISLVHGLVLSTSPTAAATAPLTSCLSSGSVYHARDPAPDSLRRAIICSSELRFPIDNVDVWRVNTEAGNRARGGGARRRPGTNDTRSEVHGRDGGAGTDQGSSLRSRCWCGHHRRGITK
jgi:hypothetical protein